jgi:hypothetical protein
MKRKLSILFILVIIFGSSLILADEGKSVSFIVTGNVRAEFNLCG